MKELFLPLGLLTVLATGVYFALGVTGNAPLSFFPTGQAEAANVEATPPPAPTPEPAPAKRRKSAPASPAPEIETAAIGFPQGTVAGVPPSVAAAVAPAPPKRRRPVNPTEIAVGMPSGSVVDLFGPPSLTTTTIDSGNLIETYVYLGNRPGELTRILIENGKVSPGTR